MANAPSSTLVLAGTGKTGSRVAGKRTKLGLRVRTAAHNGADAPFDWDDPVTHSAALMDIVTGVPSASFADFARRTAHAWARQGA
jgi:uncharacterized protein YbjT (DUF2867 family)